MPEIHTRALDAAAVGKQVVKKSRRGYEAEAWQTNVPVLMIAETHGAEEAIQIIQSNHMERGLELEQLALEARAEFQRALMERGGH